MRKVEMPAGQLKGKSILFLLLMLFLSFNQGKVWGQLSISSFPYSQNFNSTSSITLPTGWQIYSKSASAMSNTADAVITSSNTISSSTTGEAYVYYYSATPDGGIGFITTGTFGYNGSPNPQIQFSFTNNTGSIINSLDVSVAYTKYRTGTSHELFSVTGSNGIVPTSLSYTYAADGSVTSSTLPGSVVSTNTGTITGLSIANGATYTLTWTLTGGGANGHALGIDNVAISLPAITGTYLPMTGGTLNGSLNIPANSVGIGTSTTPSLLSIQSKTYGTPSGNTGYSDALMTDTNHTDPLIGIKSNEWNSGIRFVGGDYTSRSGSIFLDLSAANSGNFGNMNGFRIANNLEDRNTNFPSDATSTSYLAFSGLSFDGSLSPSRWTTKEFLRITNEGTITVDGGSNNYYNAGDYLTMGNTSYGNSPYIAFNANLSTSSSTINLFTPGFCGSPYYIPGYKASGLIIKGDAGQSGLHFLQYNYSNGTDSNYSPVNMNAFTEVFTLTNAGKIGIGTTNPTEMLAVNGNILTKKVRVTQNGWPDYVFDSAYKLQPLENVANYIKNNKHLPDVPAAAEMSKEGGLDLGDNQAVLMRKIEELTLYMITQQKQIEELKIQNEKTSKVNEEMQKKIEQLEKKGIN